MAFERCPSVCSMANGFSTSILFQTVLKVPGTPVNNNYLRLLHSLFYYLKPPYHALSR